MIEDNLIQSEIQTRLQLTSAIELGPVHVNDVSFHQRATIKKVRESSWRNERRGWCQGDQTQEYDSRIDVDAVGGRSTRSASTDQS